MRKLLLLITALLTLGASGAWAEDYSQGYYTISPGMNTNYQGFYNASNANSKYGGSSSKNTALAYFTFEKTGQENVYYWYDCSNKKYIYADGSGYLQVADTKNTNDNNYKWFIKDDGAGNLTITDMTNYNNGNPTKGLVQLESVGGWWASKSTFSQNSGRTTWKFNLLMKKNVPYYIGLQRAADRYLQYGSNKMQQAQVSTKSVEHIWYFTDEGTGSTKIYALPNITAMGYAADATDGADKIATTNSVKNFYIKSTNNTDYPFAFLTDAQNSTLYISNNGGTPYANMGLYSNINDGGTRLRVEDATDFFAQNQTVNLITSNIITPYSGGAGTSEARVSITHNGGTITLTGAEKTYYLTGSNNATQSTVNFDGTSVNYNNELGIGTAIYNINNSQITTPKFITSQGDNGRSAVVNLTGNTVITVTGNSNVDTNQSSIMIGHWNGSSDVTLSGAAKIEAVDAQFLIGKTGNTQTITLNDNSNITAKGIKASANASGTNTLNLNGGSLDLGDVGITSYSNSRSIAVNVNENATITATAATLPISQPITVASGKILTIDGGESDAAVTLTTNPSSLTNNGTIILDGAGLGGSERITTKGVFTIKDLKGNELTNSTNGYALVGNDICTLNLEGTCDFTKKSDGTTPNSHSQLGYGGGSTINIKEGANVTTAAIYNSSTLSSNTAVVVESDATLTCTIDVVSTSLTNNGTITAPKLKGPVTLAAGSTTTLSDATPFNSGAVTVSGDATLNLTNATPTLSEAITVASGKTLTIDGKNNTVVLTGALTNEGTVIFKNATLTANLSDRNLTNYTFTDCTATLQFSETGDEYKAGGFTITNIPTGVTVKVKKYDATDYETVTPVEGTATISHEVGVSGLAAWLDYTFNELTKSTNIHSPADQVITNAGNAGSGNNLTIDTGYNTDNSYNEDGTLKVMSTPWRDITWPSNYTVAVAGNVPDVENGCLVAFGSVNGTGHYLAIIRGTNQNEIKLVKGYTKDKAFEVISTMTAANATALSHLVVFTKNGNTFTVYLDGVQKTQVAYSETLGGGFQIGSIHGGVGTTGIVRVPTMSDATAKAKVFAKAIRVYDYVISADQMEALTEEFPYVSYGGTYSRTITANSNLSATNAWLNKGTQGHVDVPVNAIVNEVTYYPDVEITTTAASTLTVNANMDTENIKFDGAGKLTIASDGEHNIHIYGSLTANGPVSVKYGEIDLTAVPVSIGESGSVEFDFSAYDFSSVNAPTDYPVTGNTADYGSKVTGVYPVDDYHTYTLAHNGSTNSYILTVEPSVKWWQEHAIALVSPYYDGNHVGAGVGKYIISLGETSYTTFADFETAVMSWETLGDCVEPTIEINQPTSAFYRIKSDSKYLQDIRKSDEATQRTLTDAEGANVSAETIFYLDNNRLIGYKTGYGFQYSVCQTRNTERINTQLFTESSEMGKYTIQSQQGTCASATDNVGYWGVNGSDLSREADAASGASWTIESVTSLPVTIKTAKYATLYSPVALTIPTGVTVYTATDNGTYLSLTPVSTTIPKETGVILYADVDVETAFNFPIADDVDPISSALTGDVATISKPSGAYYLGNGASGVGFYSTDESTSITTLAGFKAYLPASSSAKSFIGFQFDEDGIEMVQDAESKVNDYTIYNLAGQRIKKLQRGINIVNGQKVLVK